MWIGTNGEGSVLYNISKALLTAKNQGSFHCIVEIGMSLTIIKVLYLEHEVRCQAGRIVEVVTRRS